MELCPPEICHQIFSLACTDGGYTGRSLSLVSRYIHEASHPVRYRCISVSGRKQLLAFSTFVETTSSGACSQIRHLLLSDQRSDYEDWMVDMRRHFPAGGSSSRNLLRRLVGREKWTPPNTGWPEGMAAAEQCMVRILQAVSSTLRTLVIFLVPRRSFILVPVFLPALEEFTCYYRHGTSMSYQDLTRSQPTLPCLKRLHIICGYQPASLARLSAVAPTLTHLRYSDLYAFPTFSRFLYMLLDMQNDGGGPAHNIAPLPSSTRVVITHTRSTASTQDRDDTPQMSKLPLHINMMTGLRALAKEDTSGRFVLLEGGVEQEQRLEKARREWLDRARGGEGCWACSDPCFDAAAV